MCRLMAFMGQEPLLVADVVLWPDRSIIKQVREAPPPPPKVAPHL
jgi:hypothetical protein